MAKRPDHWNDKLDPQPFTLPDGPELITLRDLRAEVAQQQEAQSVAMMRGRLKYGES